MRLQSCVIMWQAWLVPHTAEEGGNMSCGLGAAAAVHSGFAASWQSGLKQAVCKLLREVATQQGSKPGGMHLLVTGKAAQQLQCWFCSVSSAASSSNLSPDMPVCCRMFFPTNY